MSFPPHKKPKIVEDLQKKEPQTGHQKDGPLNGHENDIDTKMSPSSPNSKFDPSLLIGPAISGDISLVKELLAAGAPIDAQDQDGLSALAMAAICGHKDIVRVLLNAGATTASIHPDLGMLRSCFPSDWSIIDVLLDVSQYVDEMHPNLRHMTLPQWAAKQGNTSLMKAAILAGTSVSDDDGLDFLNLAARSGHAGIVKILIDARAPVNEPCPLDRSPLSFAAENGHVDIVRMLLGARATQEVDPSYDQVPALMLAVRKGHTDVVRLLVCDKGKLDRGEGILPLKAAVEQDQVEIAQILVDAGAYDEDISYYRQDYLLHEACYRNSTDLTRILIAAKADPDRHPARSLPVLLTATSHGQADIVKELLVANPNTEATDRWNMTAMWHAVKGGHLDIVKVLAVAGADVNVEVEDDDEDADPTTPMMLAIERGDNEAADILIKAGIHVNAKDKYDNTPLKLAACKGNVELVRMLLAAKARLEVRNDSGRTALMTAACVGNIEVTRELIKAGADVNARDDNDHTPILLACNAAVADALIAARADVNVPSRDGYTPLMQAARLRHADVVDSLLKAGADVNAKEFSGMSALLYGLQIDSDNYQANEAAVQTLLHAKADVDGVDKEGNPVLLLAVRQNLSVVQMLLDAGAAMNARNREGKSALISSIEHGDLDIASLLISHRPDVEVRDNEGNTALIKAARTGSIRAVKMLLDAGARWEPRHSAERDAFQSVCAGAFSKRRERSLRRRHAGDEDPNGDEEKCAPTLTGADLVQLVELLIAAKADVNPTSHTPLIAASESPQVLQLLLNAGARVDARNHEGRTALLSAASAGARESVELLLDAKADVNAMDDKNTTALKYAVGREDVRTAEVLFAAGAQAELGYFTKSSPLFEALSLDQPDMLRVLLEGKADVQKLKCNTKPLEDAVTQNKIEIMKLLVDAGLNLSQSTKLSAHLLNATVKNHHGQMLQLLLEAKAPVDAIDPLKSTETPLMNALRWYRREAILPLLAAGARLENCQFEDGSTVLSCFSVIFDPPLLKYVLSVLCDQFGYLEPFNRDIYCGDHCHHSCHLDDLRRRCEVFKE